jgi:hypothetical protein
MTYLDRLKALASLPENTDKTDRTSTQGGFVSFGGGLSGGFRPSEVIDDWPASETLCNGTEELLHPPTLGKPPPSEQTKPTKPIVWRTHPQLVRALPRELWQDGNRRSFLLDTAVRAAVPLTDAVPNGIDTWEWRWAVAALSAFCAGLWIPRGYDNQPVLTLQCPDERNVGEPGQRKTVRA